jgi:quinol monooxygenase YgiN
MTSSTPLAPYLAEPTQLGDEISITGKWIPRKPGGRFRTSEESREMLQEWEDIHRGARADAGVLATEVNHAVGEDAVLVHHVFENGDALTHYFATTAAEHMGALTAIAKPDLHIVRARAIPADVIDAVRDKTTNVAFGEHLFGFVRYDYRLPDPATAINVTAKWTTKSGTTDELEDLTHWWQQVATDAYDLEQGMVRFEAYQVIDENALIIHEVFDDTTELKYHLTKGTADRYKKHIDRVADPERYFFRGPVSWTIRTYSKFMHLPATYSSRGSHHTRPGGSKSDGTT